MTERLSLLSMELKIRRWTQRLMLQSRRRISNRRARRKYRILRTRCDKELMAFIASSDMAVILQELAGLRI